LPKGSRRRSCVADHVRCVRCSDRRLSQPSLQMSIISASIRFDTTIRPVSAKELPMDIRKTVTLVEEINSEYGASAKPPLRRVAIAAVSRTRLPGRQLAPILRR
jgi:hypothetical protein